MRRALCASLLLIIGFLAGDAFAQTPGPAPGNGCIRFVPDTEPFPFASLADARASLATLNYTGGDSPGGGMVWSFYENSAGGLAVDVYDFMPESRFGSAMVWRRPDPSGNSNDMLVSTMCESTVRQCIAFNRFLNDQVFLNASANCATPPAYTRSISIHAQVPPSSGNYDQDIGALHGSILSAELKRNICARHFPARAEALNAAHDQWREIYQPFLQEVDKAFQARLWVVAGRDKNRLKRVTQEFREQDLQYEGGLEELMLKGGEPQLRFECDHFEEFLASLTMNLEESMPEHVKMLRRGH